MRCENYRKTVRYVNKLTGAIVKNRIIQFPVRQQPRIGSDLGTVELQLQPTVKTKPQNPYFPFTHRVSHINTPNSLVT